MSTFKPYQNKNIRKQVHPADIEHLREMAFLYQMGLPAAFVTDAFFVKQDDYIIRIRHKSILWLQADGNYTEVYTSEREKPILLVHNIGRVEEFLPQRYFVRISRSVIINIAIKRAQKASKLALCRALAISAKPTPTSSTAGDPKISLCLCALYNNTFFGGAAPLWGRNLLDAFYSEINCLRS